jgi:glyoxylase-like metal-dependent hydrolase (beta-lactamase superfamily II)
LKPKKVTGPVYCVGDSEMTDSRDCSVYLVDAGGELVLIDAGAGPGAPAIAANIKACGLDPARLSTLILTHCHIDHVGGASWFRERFGVRTVMHEIEAPIVERGDLTMTAASWYGLDLRPLTIDVKIAGPEEPLRFPGLDIVCLHTPGHSPGSISAYVDTGGKRVLFGQDIHGPFLKEFGADLKAWTHSMEILLGLKADILCEGHFGIYQPASAVAAYIERYLDEYGE